MRSLFNTAALMAMGLITSGCLAPRFDSSPIHTASIENAIAGNNIQRVKQLLLEGTNPNALARNGTPLLNIAAYTNRVAIAQLLLDRGADFEARDLNGLTALHAAAYSGSLGFAKVLVERGASVNALTRSGMRPLNFSTVHGFPEVSKLLQLNGASMAPVNINLGDSILLLSVEAQEYLTIVSQSHGPTQASILVIGEPHQHRVAQWKLYKGLEILLRENPWFAARTIFLAEGLVRDKEVSVDSLIAADPTPDDCTIKLVIDSFLITGYMAHEWKWRIGTRIIGVEDPLLYRTSVALHLAGNELPRHAVQVARNKSMGETVLSHLSSSKRPILFIGGGHLDKTDQGAYDRSRSAAENTLEPIVASRVDEAQNRGVSDFLAAASVGYIYLESGVGNWSAVGSVDSELYTMIFRSQMTGSYEAYISNLTSLSRSSDSSDCR